MQQQSNRTRDNNNDNIKTLKYTISSNYHQYDNYSVPQAQLLHFYLTVIRPILEYAAPVWQYLVTKSQTDQIEAIQKKSSQHHLYWHLGHALCQFFVPRWTRYPCGVQKKTVSQVL